MHLDNLLTTQCNMLYKGNKFVYSVVSFVFFFFWEPWSPNFKILDPSLQFDEAYRKFPLQS